MTILNKYCLYCGQSLPSDALFCDRCGREQNKANTAQSPYVPAPYSAGPTKRLRPWSLTKAILLLLISVALIISMFLPIASSEVDASDNASFTVSVTPVKLFSIFAGSFRNVSDDDLFDEMQDMLEDAEDEIEDATSGEISKSDERAASRLVMSLIGLAYQADGVTAPEVMKLFAILFIAYAVISILLFIFSLIYLIKVITDPEGCERKYRVSATLFALMPTIMIALFYTAASGLFQAFYSSALPELGISVAFIIMLAVTGAVLLTLIIGNLISGAKKRQTRIAPRIIAACASLLIVCSVFLPVVSSSVKTTFDGAKGNRVATVSHASSVFAALQISEEEAEYYEEIAKNKTSRQEELDFAFHSFSLYSSKEANRGDADHEFINYMMLVSSVFGLYEYWWAFALIPVIYALVLISAGIILWLNLSALAGGGYSRATSIVFKILAFFFAAVALGAIIAFVMLQQFYIDELKLSKIYAFGTHFGLYLMAVLALLNIFVPSRVFMKKRNVPTLESAPITSALPEAEESVAEEATIESADGKDNEKEENIAPTEAPEAQISFCPECGEKHLGRPAFCKSCGKALK